MPDYRAANTHGPFPLPIPVFHSRWFMSAITVSLGIVGLFGLQAALRGSLRNPFVGRKNIIEAPIGWVANFNSAIEWFNLYAPHDPSCALTSQGYYGSI